MYEELTKYLPKLHNAHFGEWIIDNKNDGSPEHPKQFPFVDYGPEVTEFMYAVYRFVDEHKSMNLTQYSEILKESNLEWESDSMKNADPSVLDGRTVMALIVGAIRAERFCDGALLEFCEKGCITKWLTRLKQIDTVESGHIRNEEI